MNRSYCNGMEIDRPIPRSLAARVALLPDNRWTSYPMHVVAMVHDQLVGGSALEAEFVGARTRHVITPRALLDGRPATALHDIHDQIYITTARSLNWAYEKRKRWEFTASMTSDSLEQHMMPQMPINMHESPEQVVRS